MRAYEEYKDSGYDWLGKIPAHWNWHYLFQACSEQLIKNKNREDLPVLSLSYGKIIIKENINFGLTPKDYADYQIVNPGNIILRLTDLQNDHKSLRTGLVENKGIITSAYTCLKSIHNSRFIHYLLHSYDCQKVFYGMGGGVRQSIGYEQIKNLKLPIPPREEQDAIVRFLDAKCAKIDRLIKLKERQIELLNEKKQNIINQAVTKGLDPHAPMKDSGVDWIGEIPEEWEVRKVKQLCNIVDCKNRTPEAVDGGLYYAIRTSCIKNGKFSLEGAIETDEKNCVAWNTKGKPQKGDILFTREAPMGEACLVPDMQNICMGQRVMFFRPYDFDADIILYNIYSNVVKEYISFESNGSTVGHLRLGQVGNMPIVWMNKEYQNEIKKFLEEKIENFEKSCQNLVREINLLVEYRQSLISNTVTGKLNVVNN